MYVCRRGRDMEEGCGRGGGRRVSLKTKFQARKMLL